MLVWHSIRITHTCCRGDCCGGAVAAVADAVVAFAVVIAIAIVFAEKQKKTYICLRPKIRQDKTVYSKGPK